MRFGAKGLRAVLATTAALVAVLVVAGVAGAAGPQHRHHDRRPGGEFYFKLSEKTLPRPGTVAFVFRNVGHLSHDFKIDGKTTLLIKPGKTARLTVRFTKKGRYPYMCTVPGHAAAGMKGVFTLR
jgi:uncharacterized cupredoxin-like copper-binding protein